MTDSASSTGANPLDRIIVVLWETQDLVNIAGTIRAMKNFGLQRLRLVAPAEWDPWRIEGIAHDTSEIVEGAELFDSLPADDEMQGMMVMLMARRPNDPAITDRLIRIAKTSTNRELRQQAVFWLSQSKDPRATRLLEEMLAE